MPTSHFGGNLGPELLKTVNLCSHSESPWGYLAGMRFQWLVLLLPCSYEVSDKYCWQITIQDSFLFMHSSSGCCWPSLCPLASPPPCSTCLCPNQYVQSVSLYALAHLSTWSCQLLCDQFSWRVSRFVCPQLGSADSVSPTYTLQSLRELGEGFGVELGFLEGTKLKGALSNTPTPLPHSVPSSWEILGSVIGKPETQENQRHRNNLNTSHLGMWPRQILCSNLSSRAGHISVLTYFGRNSPFTCKRVSLH